MYFFQNDNYPMQYCQINCLAREEIFVSVLMVLAWWDQLQSSDEEEPAEEEAEATRLQQQMAASLRPEDYEIDEVESEMSDEEDTLEVTLSMMVLL